MLSACLSFYLVDACLSRHSQPPPQTVGIGVPVAFVFLHYLTTGDRLDLVHALLTISLTVLLTGIITDLIKVSVGRWFILDASNGSVCRSYSSQTTAGFLLPLFPGRSGVV